MQYRIDPFYRDERGRFVPGPAEAPDPVRLLLDNGATRKRVAGPHLLARSIREDDGGFRVVISRRTR